MVHNYKNGGRKRPALRRSGSDVESLADFVRSTNHSNPFLPWVRRGKNTFGLARRQPLASTKPGKARCDKSE